jgi:signal transduction histidine kinase/ligand-binding sensor domain-containing protein
MWFGTKDGINRFDGISFKVFRPDPADSNSLGNNFAYSLHEDKRGILWVGTREGLYRYNAATENFRFIKNTGWSDVRDLASDNTGNLWFVVGLKLYRYNELKDSLPELINNNNTQISSICVLANDELWAATSEGKVQQYNSKTKQFTIADVFNHSRPSPSRWIDDIYDTGKGSLLIGTSNQGIKCFDIASHTYKDILTYNGDGTEVYGRDFIHYGGDEYWIATESGIYIYNIRDNSFINLRKKYNDPYSISDNAVYSLCKDKEGGIWAGTYFGGVNYYPHQYTSFQKFFPDNTPSTISGNAVREICEDQYGHLWIGTEDGGLNKMEPASGKITHYLPGAGRTSISYSNIHGILAVGKELWIGTFEHGLDVMDIATGKVIRHYSGGGGASSFRGNFILTLFQTRAGEILAGTPLGLFKYEKKGDHFTAVQEAPENLFIYSILEDQHGTIWLGTIGSGIYFYNTTTGKRGQLQHDPKNANSLPSNLVNNVFEDSNHNLWFATEGGGLCLYNPDSSTLKRYTTRNGLPSDFVFKVLEDGRKNLWISTSRGLTCFNPATGSMKVFTKANGLLGDQFNYNSGYKDKQGRMYFGSVKGLISFNPDEFTQNNFIPPVYITGFQVDNKELSIGTQGSPLPQSILQTAQITLHHTQSSFSIDFATLSYTAPEMTEYAYKMEGLDKEWTHLATNRKVYFTGLTPGTYHFMVKAANSSGAWNSRVLQLQIRILPPFWASIGAYLLYALLVIFVVLYIIRHYHRRTEEKNKRKIELLEHEKEKELYQAKIEFFTNVAHEIKTPLTLIKGPLEKVIKRSDGTPEWQTNLRIMERNTNRLIDLTNQLLDFRQTETKGFSLTFTPINISELLEEMYANFKPLAEERNLSYNIDLPATPLYTLADLDALNKIFSNVFSNAIKYAGSKVMVQLLPVTPTDQHFTIQVANDGYLIPSDMKEKIFEPFFRLKKTEKQKGTGIGLALARSLAQLHKGNLYLKEQSNELNTFVISLPVTDTGNGTVARESNDNTQLSVNQ